MTLLFSLVSWVTVILAAKSRQRIRTTSLNSWDEAAAFFALGLACSIALEFVR